MKKEIYGIIYLIRNEINNKVYIGQTTQEGGFDRRYGNDLKNKTHNDHLKNSIKKYGIDNFYIDKEFDIAYSKEELDMLEDMYIKIYNTTDRKYGYNKQTGGSKGIPNNEVRIKMSESQKGRKHNEETKEKIRQANLGSNNHSSKKVICITTAKVFDCIKDTSIFYNCNICNISDSCNNKSCTSGEFNSIRLKWMYYDDYLNSSKEEIDDRLDDIWNSHGKAVVCITTGRKFTHAKQASDFYGANHSRLCGCCRNKRGTSGKLKDGTPLRWLFYKDYISMTKEEIEEYKVKRR